MHKEAIDKFQSLTGDAQNLNRNSPPQAKMF